MQTRPMNVLESVSALTLGGGGLGQLWGETTRAECVAAVHEAMAAGITLFDLAPLYGKGESERVLGEAFRSRSKPSRLSSSSSTSVAAMTEAERGAGSMTAISPTTSPA